MSKDARKSEMLEKFLQLLEEATSLDSYVSSAQSNQKLTTSKLQKLKIDELKTEIKEFGEAVAKEYYKLGEKAPEISSATHDLLHFISENTSDIEEFIPDCKPPLRPGDITFDDIAGNEDIKEDIRKNYIYPFRYPGLFKNKSKGILLYGPPGTGKCLAPDEKVVMFDGTLKEAKYIIKGDLLMGDDSTYRTVLNTCSGEDEMFRITPSKGEPFVVNAPHILSLVSSRKSMENKIDIIDIPLNEYITKSSSWKSQYKGYRVGADWDTQEVPFDPYILGVWLGDGSSHQTLITNTDQFVLDELSRESNLIKNKHIPLIYKANDRTTRLELLAGLIDSDGYLTCNCYEIIQKSLILANDIAFVARSLGFYVSIKECHTNSSRGPVTGIYHKIMICGDGIENIPVRIERKKASSRRQIKNINHFGFEVQSLGNGKYCGFTLDGNSRFLLKDFTVTHNTLLARAATAAIPGAAFFAPTPGELRGKYEGETEKNIGKVFACAQQILKEKGSPYRVAVIFIDEFDSLAGARGEDPGMQRSVNALLQAMDGIKTAPDVSVIAATNLPWSIDGAIRRRFSAEIFVDLPDAEAREFIIRQSIMKNFSFPGDIHEIYDSDGRNFNDAIFESITRYGKEMCSVKKDVVVTYYFSSSVEEQTNVYLVDGNYISQVSEGSLLERTGPNEAAKTLLDKIKNTKIEHSELELDSIEYGDLKFGYSGSDVDKLMVTCVQISSLRALDSGYVQIEVDGEKYYRSVPYQEGTHALLEYVVDDAESHGVTLKLLSDEESNRALNFAFCQGDVTAGLDKYPSTINSKDYVDMIVYKYRGEPPKK